jgi:iron complex transport system ATP-binding protein
MVKQLQHGEQPLLAAEKVCYGYRGRQALFYDVSTTIARGEMVGLLGPNGSGKTTLLRLFSGVLHPQQGRIVLEGRDLRQWGRREVARHVAVVPQELQMPFAYTVRQMVDLGRTPFTRSFWGGQSQQDCAIVLDAMTAAGVTPLAERVFNELSGGERQRVTVAMALAQQPTALLLDEPTAHLDIKYQIEVLELARTLNRERGVTIIAALHDLNLAARYFPRLLLFQRGIVADGSPAEVLEPGLLRRVYGVDVQVGILRGAEHLSVLPPVHSTEEDVVGQGQADSRSGQPMPPVHVIAGGGSGALLMRALADAHIPFSAGVLNIGDSDHTLALRLAEDVLSEQPFAPVSAPLLTLLRARLQSTSVLIICPTAIGSGNLALFQEAVQAARQGLSVVLLTEPVTTVCAPIGSAGECAMSDNSDNSDNTALMQRLATLDYTDGDGTLCLEQLVQEGAIFAHTLSQALDAIRQRIDCSLV